MKRIFCLVLAAAMLLTLTACGDGNKKDMADAVAKAAVEALEDKETVYGSCFLIFTPSEDKKSTYVMTIFYYRENETTVEDCAIGVFSGGSMTDFALREVNSDEYYTLLDAMPVNNTEKFAKQSLIDEVCKNNGIATYAQAKTDLGII